jgi:ABC-type amino acid transport substrate-binding protein
MHHDHLAATGRRFATYPTVDALAEALVAGEIDLAYGGWQDGLLADLSAKGIEPLYQENLTAAGISMAICKGNSALLAALNAAIAGMWADGTIDAFSARWFVE